MSLEAVERRLSAILSADVAGYTRLMAQDEGATLRTLTDYREEITRIVSAHHGRIVDAPGDNVLAELSSALDAVACAVAIQGSLRERNAELPEDRRMEFRIGVHLGDVAVESSRIYGDGVNIAARIEGLANPGGVCVSSAVYDQVRNKLALPFEDMGEQRVKNVANPVRVYRVQLGETPVSEMLNLRGSAAWLKSGAMLAAIGVSLFALVLLVVWPLTRDLALDSLGLAGPPVNPPLPESPSIAVLPFVNMSGDPEQEYFSDGITEEVIAGLAGNPTLFVISRSSTFAYKGRPVRVEDVGRELGVRYVLEGSVRKAGDRVRVTAQLIDATSGFHVWSEQYNRQLENIFELQSELALDIMGQLSANIGEAENERVRRKPTRNTTAYDLYMRGISEVNAGPRDANLRGRELFKQALELDPMYMDAEAMLGISYVSEYGNAWSSDPNVLAQGEQHCLKARQANPGQAVSHTCMAWVYAFRDEPAEAIAEARRAVELSPSLEWPHAVLALALAQNDQPVEAMQSTKRALRLNPRAASGVLFAVAYVNYAAGRRDKAVELFERIRRINADLIMAQIPLAAIYEEEGRHEEARQAVAQVLRVRPDMTVAEVHRLIGRWFGDDEATDFHGHLVNAGLPKG